MKNRTEDYISDKIGNNRFIVAESPLGFDSFVIFRRHGKVVLYLSSKYFDSSLTTEKDIKDKISKLLAYRKNNLFFYSLVMALFLILISVAFSSFLILSFVFHFHLFYGFFRINFSLFIFIFLFFVLLINIIKKPTNSILDIQHLMRKDIDNPNVQF